MDASTIVLCLSVFPWAEFRAKKGAVKLHTVLDHDGLTPAFVDITDGKTHEVKMGRQVTLPKGSILTMDRGYIDYQWFNELNGQGVYFVTLTSGIFSIARLNDSKRIEKKHHQ